MIDVFVSVWGMEGRGLEQASLCATMATICLGEEIGERRMYWSDWWKDEGKDVLEEARIKEKGT